MIHYVEINKIIKKQLEEERLFCKYLKILKSACTLNDTTNFYHHHGGFFKMINNSNKTDFNQSQFMTGLYHSFLKSLDFGLNLLKIQVCGFYEFNKNYINEEEKQCLNDVINNKNINICDEPLFFNTLRYIYENKDDIWFSHHVDDYDRNKEYIKNYDSSSDYYPNTHWGRYVSVYHGKLWQNNLWSEFHPPLGLINLKCCKNLNCEIKVENKVQRDHLFLNNSIKLCNWIFVIDNNANFFIPNRIANVLLTKSKGFISKKTLDCFLDSTEAFLALWTALKF